jgi:hypothetical protein
MEAACFSEALVPIYQVNAATSQMRVLFKYNINNTITKNAFENPVTS